MTKRVTGPTSLSGGFTALTKRMALALTLAWPAMLFAADFNIAVGLDPADDISKQTKLLGMSPAPSISSALGAKVLLKQTSDLTDVMRATRTQENDVLIGPPNVIASALNHGYELVARDPRNVQFVMVVRPEIKAVEDLAGKRLYLTQQDSLRAYLARGLFADAKFDMRKLSNIVFGKTSGAGMLALQSDLADATVAEQNEAQAWIKSHPGRAVILKVSRTVPSGNGVAVLKKTAETDRRNLLRWATSGDATGFGKMQAASEADNKAYGYIASLGIVTPPAIAGVTLIDASEVARLVAGGAVPVDVRTAKEFNAAHIAGAINLPYVERSLKDKDFDAAMDDFSALAQAPAGKALIFFCNGPECWKSYKASRYASNKGYKNVYWYRKGMPDWRDKAMAIQSTRAPALP